MNKQLAKNKIEKVVKLYADQVKADFGIVIDTKKEFKRIYADFQAGLITLNELEEEINLLT